MTAYKESAGKAEYEVHTVSHVSHEYVTQVEIKAVDKIQLVKQMHSKYCAAKPNSSSILF